jgi:hypothetical protein
MAPIAPDPLVPEGSTPAKLITVIEETTACDRVAVTDSPLSVPGANAHQTSDVPLCPFALTTKVQVKPPPVTPVTVVFGPDSQSVEMKANNSSLPEVVENVGVTSVVFARAWSTETLASTDIAAKPMFVAARMQPRPKMIFMQSSYASVAISLFLPRVLSIQRSGTPALSSFLSSQPFSPKPATTRDYTVLDNMSAHKAAAMQEFLPANPKVRFH